MPSDLVQERLEGLVSSLDPFFSQSVADRMGKSISLYSESEQAADIIIPAYKKASTISKYLRRENRLMIMDSAVTKNQNRIRKDFPAYGLEFANNTHSLHKLLSGLDTGSVAALRYAMEFPVYSAQSKFTVPGIYVPALVQRIAESPETNLGTVREAVDSLRRPQNEGITRFKMSQLGYSN